MNEEYIFRFSKEDDLREDNLFVSIVAGKESVRLYRQNLLERLAEAFVNLEWIYKNQDQFFEEEFRVYESRLSSPPSPRARKPGSGQRRARGEGEAGGMRRGLGARKMCCRIKTS